MPREQKKEEIQLVQREVNQLTQAERELEPERLAARGHVAGHCCPSKPIAVVSVAFLKLLPLLNLFEADPPGVLVVVAFVLYIRAAEIGAVVVLIVKLVAALPDPVGKAVIALQRIKVKLAVISIPVDIPGVFHVLGVAVPRAVLTGAVVRLIIGA